MEKYHWLPQDIAKIPYKKIQKIRVIEKQRGAAQESRMNKEKFKSQQQSISSGRTKRFTREV